MNKKYFALIFLFLLGAGCNPIPEKPKTVSTPIAPRLQNALIPDTTNMPIDPDFTAGSEYMQETPERYEDLHGKKPFLMYFYADWCPECRKEHPALRALYDTKKIGMPILRVNYKDNQVTDEGVEWAKQYGIVTQHTFIILDASGKEIGRHIGPIDEKGIRELMGKI